MSSEIITKHLAKLKSQKRFDDGFIDILTKSNDNGEDSLDTAEKIRDLIKERYAQSKKNQT